MTKFELLFGIKESGVKKNCILMPLLPKGVLEGFKTGKLSRGKLYSSGNSKDFTLVQTGVGAGFTGDAVLYLKDTPCENLVLFGSCGLVSAKSSFDMESLVSPFECYSQDSFSSQLLYPDMLNGIFSPDKELFEKLLQEGVKAGVKKVLCSTVSSLKLEEEWIYSFSEKGVDVVDMESSAFFAAAEHSGLKAAALFYVNDIINSAPFYNLDDSQKQSVDVSVKKAVAFLNGFMKNL